MGMEPYGSLEEALADIDAGALKQLLADSPGGTEYHYLIQR